MKNIKNREKETLINYWWIVYHQKLFFNLKIDFFAILMNFLMVFDFTQFWLNGRPGNEYFIISHKISGLLTPLRVHPQWFETDLRHSSYIAIKGCAMIDLIDEFQSTNARKCLQQKNYELWGSLGSQVCWHSTVVIR